jgi:hypothetical protein
VTQIHRSRHVAADGAGREPCGHAADARFTPAGCSTRPPGSAWEWTGLATACNNSRAAQVRVAHPLRMACTSSIVRPAEAPRAWDRRSLGNGTLAVATSSTDQIDGAVSELLNVPGIGKATATAMRASGRVQSVADLREVRPCDPPPPSRCGCSCTRVYPGGSLVELPERAAPGSADLAQRDEGGAGGYAHVPLAVLLREEEQRGGHRALAAGSASATLTQPTDGVTPRATERAPVGWLRGGAGGERARAQAMDLAVDEEEEEEEEDYRDELVSAEPPSPASDAAPVASLHAPDTVKAVIVSPSPTPQWGLRHGARSEAASRFPRRKHPKAPVSEHAHVRVAAHCEARVAYSSVASSAPLKRSFDAIETAAPARRSASGSAACRG